MTAQIIRATNSSAGVAAYGNLTAVATCPAGTTLTGGGGTWSSSSHNGSVSATENYPSASDTWTYTAQVQNTGNTVQVSVAAYAICAG